MNKTACTCKCGCWRGRGQNCDSLCEECWLEWCQGSENHAPVVSNSYLGTYGINNIWTGWLVGQAPHLVAERPEALLRPEAPRWCPDCDQQMSRRPGAWKCYRHQQPVVILEEVKFPRSPKIDAIGVCQP